MIRTIRTLVVVTFGLISVASRSVADGVYSVGQTDTIYQSSNGTTTPYATISPPSSQETGEAITADKSGNLFVLGTEGTIFKVAAGSQTGVAFSGSQNLGGSPQSIVASASGNLYANGNGGIYNISSTGQISSSPLISGTFRGQMAIDSQGNVYAIQADGNNVYNIEKFSSSGQDLGNFASLALPGASVASFFGLAFDAKGNLYTSYYIASGVDQGGAIREFSSTGGDGGIFALTGYDAQGIGFDSSGNLDVALLGGGSFQSRIEQYSSSGSDLGSLGPVSVYSNFIAIIPSIPAVPGPSTFLLVGLGLPFSLLHRRLRRRVAPVAFLGATGGIPLRRKGDILECHEVSAQTQPSEQFVAT